MEHRRVSSVLFFLLLSVSLYSQTPGSKKWEFNMADVTLVSAPAIGSDGTIYTSCMSNIVYALNPDGTTKWEFHTGGNIISSPAIGVDGIIYIGSYDSSLYAINPDGSKKWEFITDNRIMASPAIGADGTIYFCSYGNILYAINSDGTEKWSFNTNAGGLSSPSIGNDGTIYIQRNKLFALNPDGTEKWEYNTPSDLYSSPAIGPGGLIYLSSAGFLIGLNTDGTEKFESSIVGESSSPAISPDGTIYCSANFKLYAFNPDGSKKWDFLHGGGSTSSPSVGNDGTLYFGSNDSILYAINPDGTKKWEFPTGGPIVSSPAIGPDGSIYIGSGDKKLYAIYSSSTGLAKSSWPSFRNNNFNTGRFTELTAFNNDFSNMALPNKPYNFNINLYNTFLYNITINIIGFNDPDFVSATSLPFIMNPGDKKNISLSLTNTQNKWYKPTVSINFTLNGASETRSYNLEGVIFLDDNSELAHTANRVMPVWKTLDKKNIGLLNNTKGVIYRLLSNYKAADSCFNIAMDTTLNLRYGYAGIMMNQGVVKSDKLIPDSAYYYYNSSIADIISTESGSVLAPQIYFNEAWEKYTASNYAEASTLALQVINHSMANEYLKAKAYALLGASRYFEGSLNEAKDALNQAISLDANGPIGKMAQANLDEILSTGVEPGNGDIGIKIYPNPGDGKFKLSTGNLSGDLNISVFNNTGRKVLSYKLNSLFYSLYDLNLSHLSEGVYFVRIELGKSIFTRKIVIIKQ